MIEYQAISLFEKLLVAIDGSPLSDKAIRAACSMAGTNTKVSLIHVIINPPIPYSEGYIDVENQLQKNGEEILNRGKNLAKSLGVEANTVIEVGDIAEEILSVAEADKCDLIIVGSRGLSKVQSFLLGSVSSKITGHAKKSVLIVR